MVNILKEKPLISVIVPVYNTEKFLKKCLESIQNQTYKNLEIILVDDACPDKCSEIMDTFVAADSRFKVVTHTENRGLFQARLTGVDSSNGDFIAFVDSDDYISVDWFRLLVKKALDTEADMVVGEWCYEFNDGRREYLNLDPFIGSNIYLEGDNVLSAFMEQEGSCFSWHVVWNKLYARTLWEKCVSSFRTFSEDAGHMLMWEDLAYSSCFWVNSKRVVNVHGIYYFYYRNEERATNISVQTHEKKIKYIKNASTAMNFFECLLLSSESSPHKIHFDKWKEKYISVVVRDLPEQLYKYEITESFKISQDDLNCEALDSDFYKIMTPVSETFMWLENLKTQIAAEKIEIVSFDIFDTLISRPFTQPQTLFEILSVEANKILKIKSYIDFGLIRREAELKVRDNLRISAPYQEEIEIDDIYKYIEQNYCFDAIDLNSIKNKEIHLEYEFCTPRNSGKELYELAKELDKKIILISDMYLAIEHIEEILYRNNYKVHSEIFLSSEVKLTKHSGSIYPYVLKKLSMSKKSANQILHIGDNWESDVVNSENYGFNSFHLPKAFDLYTGVHGGIYSGTWYQKVFSNSFHLADTKTGVQGYTSLQCIHGLIQNRLFDNPYISYHRDSDFNASPFNIGYCALGSYLLGFSTWLYERAKVRKVGTIHFVARDGYLFKEAYDILYPHEKTNYLRLSRKSLFLLDISTVNDLYSIISKCNIFNLSAKKLRDLLQPLIQKDEENFLAILLRNKIIYEKMFRSIEEYNFVLKIFITEIVDMTLLSEYKENVKKYFSKIIFSGDVLVDIGYSGRPESALSNLLGFPVSSFYIHTNSDQASKRMDIYGSFNECFYGFKPCITGVMREHATMELGPSTIGYGISSGELAPLFEEFENNPCLAYVTRTMQDGALEFVSDFIKIFGKYRDYLPFRPLELTQLFEYYLHNGAQIDRDVFSSLEFEDDFGMGTTVNAVDFWNRELNTRLTNVKTYVTLNEGSPELHDLYTDGLFVAMYQKLNKLFPKGSAKREVLKKIARIFVK